MAFKLDFLGDKINELLHKIDNLNPDDFGKIDTIKVNGTPQTITDKAVDITVPTNTNQLTNGAGFITTTAVNNKLGRTDNVNADNTSYGTYMARGEALFSTDTNPTVNGCIAWTYG